MPVSGHPTHLVGQVLVLGVTEVPNLDALDASAVQIPKHVVLTSI